VFRSAGALTSDLGSANPLIAAMKQGAAFGPLVESWEQFAHRTENDSERAANPLPLVLSTRREVTGVWSLRIRSSLAASRITSRVLAPFRGARAVLPFFANASLRYDAIFLHDPMYEAMQDVH
jgi:hypothetical protein